MLILMHIIRIPIIMLIIRPSIGCRMAHVPRGVDGRARRAPPPGLQHRPPPLALPRRAQPGPSLHWRRHNNRSSIIGIARGIIIRSLLVAKSRNRDNRHNNRNPLTGITIGIIIGILIIGIILGI